MLNKNLFLGIVGTFIVLSSVLSVSAINQDSYHQMDFWDKLKYKFSTGEFLFTSWGEANDCSTYPDWDGYLDAGERVDCDDFGDTDKCAIDVWYDNYIYLGSSKPSGYPNSADWSRLNWYREEAGEGEHFTASSSHQYWWVEVYNCPLDAPEPDHSTKAYVCEKGDWDYKGRYDYDEYCPHDTSGVDLCWCNDEDEDFYIDESENVHCRSSPRSSWCSAPTSHDSSKCYNNDIYWYDSSGEREEIKTDCGAIGCSTGASSCTISHYTKGCYNNDVYWHTNTAIREEKAEECGEGGCTNGACNVIATKGDIRREEGKSWSTTKNLITKQVTFKIPLKNYGDKVETINLEAGFYSEDYARDVADFGSIFGTFSSVPITNCNPNEEFTMAKQVTLQPGESETVQIKVDPEKAYVTYGVGTHKLNQDPVVAFWGLYSQCLGGYTNEAGTTGKGVMADYKQFATNCPLLSNVDIFCGDEKIGTCKSETLTLTKTCSIPLTTEVVAINEADTNGDGIIDRDELGSHISKWIQGQVSRNSLGGVIVAWASN